MNIAGKDIHAIFDETIQKLREDLEKTKRDYEESAQDLIDRASAAFKTAIVAAGDGGLQNILTTPKEPIAALYVRDEVYAGYDYESPAVRLMVENINIEMNRGQYRDGSGKHSQPVFQKGQRYRFIVAVVPIKEE